MPYIPPEDRTDCVGDNHEGDIYIGMSRESIGELVGDAMRNGGDLQYILAVAVQRHLENTGLRYQYCQDIMGALTGAQAEFYRCVVGPYEDAKIEENGAVYDLQKLENTSY